ncbi:hypothetical protein [Actinomadura kijaniata]|uniref:hypothetical protein n=1 Tax=Actinomadura kijaniata TaxID=46161 RepID=UPI00082FDE21|nr:hypothetical protein [Actinomadura kijaniata]
MKEPIGADELPALAAAVAAELGAAWQVAPPVVSRNGSQMTCELTRGDGHLLYVRYVSYLSTARVEIGGRFPRGPRPRDVRAPSITVMTSRGAAVIAQEIVRRLLPAYTTALARVRVHQAQCAHQDARRAQLAGQISLILPGTREGHVRFSSRSTTGLRWSSAHDRLMSASFTLREEAERVDLVELHNLPREVVTQLCCVLAAAETRRARSQPGATAAAS